MNIQVMDCDLTVCRVANWRAIPSESELLFVGKTDEELSVVCPTDRVPDETEAREDGWRAFRIVGVLDFSLVGILAAITGVLAAAGIGIFAVSTFNTDYVLVKRGELERALAALVEAGYTVISG